MCRLSTFGPRSPRCCAQRCCPTELASGRTTPSDRINVSLKRQHHFSGFLCVERGTTRARKGPNTHIRCWHWLMRCVHNTDSPHSRCIFPSILPCLVRTMSWIKPKNVHTAGRKHRQVPHGDVQETRHVIMTLHKLRVLQLARCVDAGTNYEG